MVLAAAATTAAARVGAVVKMENGHSTAASAKTSFTCDLLPAIIVRSAMLATSFAVANWCRYGYEYLCTGCSHLC